MLESTVKIYICNSVVNRYIKPLPSVHPSSNQPLKTSRKALLPSKTPHHTTLAIGFHAPSCEMAKFLAFVRV